MTSQQWQRLTTAYVLLVTVVSVIPIPDVPVRGAGALDKPVHLCEYLLFSWLILRAARASGVGIGRSIGMAWSGAVAYGALMELAQYFLPWRSADTADLQANLLGASLGALAGVLIPGAGGRRPKSHETIR